MLLLSLFLAIWLGCHEAHARAVFAHFMVTNSANYTISDWENDIKLAQAAHIDAFALNMAWNDPTNDPSLVDAFNTANSLGFKLFFSLDYAGNGPWPVDEVLNLLSKFSSQSSYYRYQGKPFVSTFEGPESADDWKVIKEKTGAFFVPDYSSLGAKAAMKLGVADGLFSWAAWPWGGQDMDTYTDVSYRQYLESGMPYMMPASPWFYTNLPGYKKNWVWRGDNLWFDRWQEIMFIQPEFVQIISWNDYGESHYIGPLYDKAMEAFDIGKAPYNYVTDMPHDGWREFLPFLIDTYKNGQATINEESLMAWYRLHPVNACSDGGTSGNTASQLQLEFSPTSIFQDRIFYSALLGSPASVTVTIGGASQEGEWDYVPDDNVGVHHGSVLTNGRTGQVVVTIHRSGATVAQMQGQAITTTCTQGIQNYNAWVGSAKGGPISATPSTKLSDQKCIQGTGANNFAGLCEFSCKYGYCPDACVCQAMGAQRKLPNATGIIGYPLEGKSPSYLGLCSFDCNYGYCPGTACGTVSAPLVTPTVSDFAPPACVAGTGEGNLAGLCSYACGFGYCPRSSCQCTATGPLVVPPAMTGSAGFAAAGLDENIYGGLCDFACKRGYCPSGACTSFGPEKPAPSGELYPNDGDYAVTGNAKGTRLFGWQKCTDDQKAFIKSAYDEYRILARFEGVTKIDFNSIAASEYLALSARNKDQQAGIQDVFEYLSSVYPSWIGSRLFNQYIRARCDDPNHQCIDPCDPNRSSATIAYTVNPVTADDYPYVNFCPRYFSLPKLADAIAYGKAGDYSERYSMLSYYRNRATIFYHEMCHVDQNIHLPPNPHIMDLKVNIEEMHGDLPVIFPHKAYGPKYTKVLARFEGDIISSAGYYVQRNADNFAMYALAIYVQKQLDNIYPAFPIVTDKIFDPPYQGHNVIQYAIEDGKVVFTNLPGDTAEADDCALSANVTSIADIDKLIPSWAYPTAYRQAKASWEEDLFPSKVLNNMKLRILPFGDSITVGTKSSDGNGYREKLVLNLAGNTVDMIGSVQAGSMSDKDNEGHADATIQDLRSYSKVFENRPNVVLLHAGTNDMAGKSDVNSAITELGGLVDDIFNSCPDTVLLMALILPSSDSTMNDRINQFNEQAVQLVRKKFESGKHILLVDMNSFVTTDDLADGKNPNDRGYQIMADAWARGLQRANAMGWISDPITSVTTTVFTTVHPTVTSTVVVTSTSNPKPTPAGYTYWFFGFSAMGDFPLFKIQGYGSSTTFDECKMSPEWQETDVVSMPESLKGVTVQGDECDYAETNSWHQAAKNAQVGELVCSKFARAKCYKADVTSWGCAGGITIDAWTYCEW